MVLTLLSGVVDAVSYLGLGRVFTANMTGNVVVLGFAAAGAPGFSIPASLTSLGAFLVGALCAGLAGRRIARRGRLLLLAMVTEAVLVGVAQADHRAIGQCDAAGTLDLEVERLDRIGQPDPVLAATG
jgi:uncharacterized membrane protein YoaK (UPF0700 family)